MQMEQEIISFVEKTMESRGYEFVASKYLRMSSIYWATNIFNILGAEAHKNKHKDDFLEYVRSCKNCDGGYGMAQNYCSSIVSTFNVLQILFIYESLEYDENVENYILSLYENGCFYGDVLKEKDTRFVCCAVLGLKLISLVKFKKSGDSLEKPICDEYLNFLSKKGIQRNEIIFNILKTNNFDGGFGAKPGDESHAANTFCSISSLRALNALESINQQKTVDFLVLRQTRSGGLNGRPNKKEDVCYSFWALSGLILLSKQNYVDLAALNNFILDCYSCGGFSDRPGNEPDLYHTNFALAGISLIGKKYKKVDAGFCI